MRAVVVSLVLLLMAAGCDISGAKFIAPSSRSVELGSHNGFLWTIPGSPLLKDGTVGIQQNLLYVLVVCPDLAASGKGTETRYGGRVNTYVSRWDTSGGPVSVRVNWDRRTDSVKIGNKTFARGTGNVFVVKRDRTGALAPLQLPSIDADLGSDEALRFIQRQISNDTVIAAIRLPQRD